MANIYIYPKIEPKLDKSINPYTLNFEKFLSQTHTIINKSNKRKGVLHLFKYLFKCDIYIFNWIEDLYIKRFGKFQIIFFLFFLLGVNILRKKIVWFLHNKYSHDTMNNKWTNFMFFLMMKYSHLIITHSLGGIEFAEKHFPRFSSKVVYYVHPVQELIPVDHELPQKYDILIWGVIFPYKGIVEFLKYMQALDDSESFKILIVGRCLDLKYKENLKQYLSESIVYLDNYYDIKEIARLANQSKFILFTHRSYSVLSSGALMDSIRMGANIIGPNFGAFKDLSSYSFIKTYNTYDDIINILRNEEFCLQSNNPEIVDFCNKYNWNSFIEKFNKELYKII